MTCPSPNQTSRLWSQRDLDADPGWVNLNNWLSASEHENSIIYSYIHLFNKYLLNAYYVLGTAQHWDMRVIQLSSLPQRSQQLSGDKQCSSRERKGKRRNYQINRIRNSPGTKQYMSLDWKNLPKAQNKKFKRL